MSDSSLRSAREKCTKLGLGGTRTVLFCMDRKTAKCASAKQMTKSWKYLKGRLKQLQLDGKPGAIRVKMDCIGICRSGPILAVMPDGIWYGNCTPEAIERIITQHIVGGKVVKDLVIAQPGS